MEKLSPSLVAPQALSQAEIRPISTCWKIGRFIAKPFHCLMTVIARIANAIFCCSCFHRDTPVTTPPLGKTHTISQAPIVEKAPTPPVTEEATPSPVSEKPQLNAEEAFARIEAILTTNLDPIQARGKLSDEVKALYNSPVFDNDSPMTPAMVKAANIRIVDWAMQRLEHKLRKCDQAKVEDCEVAQAIIAELQALKGSENVEELAYVLAYLKHIHLLPYFMENPIRLKSVIEAGAQKNLREFKFRGTPLRNVICVYVKLTEKLFEKELERLSIECGLMAVEDMRGHMIVRREHEEYSERIFQQVETILPAAADIDLCKTRFQDLLETVPFNPVWTDKMKIDAINRGIISPARNRLEKSVTRFQALFSTELGNPKMSPAITMSAINRVINYAIANLEFFEVNTKGIWNCLDMHSKNLAYLTKRKDSDNYSVLMDVLLIELRSYASLYSSEMGKWGNLEKWALDKAYIDNEVSTISDEIQECYMGGHSFLRCVLSVYKLELYSLVCKFEARSAAWDAFCSSSIPPATLHISGRVIAVSQ